MWWSGNSSWNCLHELFLDQFTIWMKWFEHLWQKKIYDCPFKKCIQKTQRTAFSVSLYSFFLFIYDCCIVTSHIAASWRCPFLRHVVSLCGGKRDRLSSLQHVSGGSLTNKYWTTYSICNDAGRAVAVFLIYTLQYLFYAFKTWIILAVEYAPSF